MSNFDSLLKTITSKRKYCPDYTKIYQKNNFLKTLDYDYFEALYIQDLFEKNKKKKYNKDLLSLWGKLDMKSYIDYDLGNTINLYLVDDPNAKNIPINRLNNYNFMPEDTKKLNLLDIKYIKHLNLENIQFTDLYLATYEILDNDNNFRPYVLLFIKNENNDFIEIRIWL